MNVDDIDYDVDSSEVNVEHKVLDIYRTCVYVEDNAHVFGHSQVYNNDNEHDIEDSEVNVEDKYNDFD